MEIEESECDEMAEWLNAPGEPRQGEELHQAGTNQKF